MEEEGRRKEGGRKELSSPPVMSYLCFPSKNVCDRKICRFSRSYGCCVAIVDVM